MEIDDQKAAVADNAAAECLYMIVMSIPGAAEQFHASEIGDVDNDGLPEFIDAWGRPIRFLRWPAGFIAGQSTPTATFRTAQHARPVRPAKYLGMQGEYRPLPADLLGGSRRRFTTLTSG